MGYVLQLANAQGTGAAKVVQSAESYLSSGALFVNPMDPPYNAKGDGVADDTAALQGAIAAFFLANKGGRLVLPPATYRTTAPLVARGILGRPIVIEGNGSTIIYDGVQNDTGAVFDLRGGDAIRIADIQFNANQKCGRAFHACYDHDRAVPCANLVLDNVRAVSARATSGESACFWIGDDNFQASEVTFRECIAMGCGPALTTTYGIRFDAANCKNFRVFGGGCLYNQYGIAHGPAGSGSGYLAIIGTSFGLNSAADVKVSGSPGATLVGCGSEDSARFLDSAGSGEFPQQTTIQGCYFESTKVPDDDYVVIVGGSLLIQASYLRNDRTPDSLAKVKSNALGTSTGSVDSSSTWYCRASNVVPVYNGLGQHVAETGRVRSFGDMGGVGGAMLALAALGSG